MIYRLIEYLRKLHCSDICILFNIYWLSVLVIEYIIGYIKEKLAAVPDDQEQSLRSWSSGSASSVTIYIIIWYLFFFFWYFFCKEDITYINIRHIFFGKFYV